MRSRAFFAFVDEWNVVAREKADYVEAPPCKLYFSAGKMTKSVQAFFGHRKVIIIMIIVMVHNDSDNGTEQ